MPPYAFFEELMKLSLVSAPTARPNLDMRGRRITPASSLAIPRESKMEASASLNRTANVGKPKASVTKPIHQINPYVQRSGFA